MVHAMAGQLNIPWVEKYRPQQLCDIVHHQHIVQLLRAFIRTTGIPHLFFYGPPGTGKTSTILSCANEVYGKHSSSMVMHLNASDERGIDVVRNQIIQFASTATLFCADPSLSKLVILDEADSMGHVAQTALRDIILEYDTRFCFIGNYQYAFEPQLMSRVIHLMFTPIPKAAALQLGVQVMGKEGHVCTPFDLESVYDIAGNDMRQFVNLLQVVAMHVSHAGTKAAAAAVTEETIRPIICRWDANTAVEYVENVLAVRDVKGSYEFLHESIILTQSNTLAKWIEQLFQVMCTKNLECAQQDPGYNRGDAQLQQWLRFSTEVAQIETTLAVSLQPDLQLFALVACAHRFLRTMSPPRMATTATA
jgi:DNA polymerase III delta prime subunit